MINIQYSIRFGWNKRQKILMIDRNRSSLNNNNNRKLFLSSFLFFLLEKNWPVFPSHFLSPVFLTGFFIWKKLDFFKITRISLCWTIVNIVYLRNGIIFDLASVICLFDCLNEFLSKWACFWWWCESISLEKRFIIVVSASVCFQIVTCLASFYYYWLVWMYFSLYFTQCYFLFSESEYEKNPHPSIIHLDIGTIHCWFGLCCC